MQTINLNPEAAMLTVLWKYGDDSLLDAVHVNDFLDPLFRFTVNEWKEMRAGGIPWNDTTAFLSWLKRSEATERFHAEPSIADDRRDGATDAAVQLITTLKTYEASTNGRYYLKLLRSARARRGLKMIAAAINEQVDRLPDDPDHLVQFAYRQLDELDEAVSLVQGES